MKTLDEEKLLDKVQKLIAKAESTNFEAEAEAFMLKAQELIAQYSLDVSKLTENELKEAYLCVRAEHSNNEGYRKNLSVALAPNFRCKALMMGNFVNFFGHSTDAKTCVEVFNRLYKVSHNIGLKLEREARSQGKSTSGVANSYWLGFIAGVKKALEKQSVALMIIVPQDVKDEMENRYHPQVGKGGLNSKRYDSEAYEKGHRDGQDEMSNKSITN